MFRDNSGNERPRLPGTASGVTVGEYPTIRGGEFELIVPRTARAVNPFPMSKTDRVAIHRDLAAWHRERAARWLEHAHVSPWHASKWREHIDAAAEHDRLAELHARQIDDSTEKAAAS